MSTFYAMRILRPSEYADYAAHLKRLDRKDRILRFCQPVTDQWIDRFVEAIGTDAESVVIGHTIRIWGWTAPFTSLCWTVTMGALPKPASPFCPKLVTAESAITFSNGVFSGRATTGPAGTIPSARPATRSCSS